MNTVKSFYLHGCPSLHLRRWTNRARRRSRGSSTGVVHRAHGRRRAGRWPGELRSRSQWEARRAAGAGRWSGSVLRGRAGERASVAPAGAAGGAAPGWAAAAEQRRLGELRPRSQWATEPHMHRASRSWPVARRAAGGGRAAMGG